MFFNKENDKTGNKNENKTAEQYYEQAEQHKNVAKNELKTFFTTGLFILSALIALIALGIAWFVYNDRVEGQTGIISVKYSGIEIGSKGRNGVHDDLLQTIVSNLTYFPSGATDEKKDTSNGASINWLLSESGNMNNYNAGNGIGNNDRKKFAIEPGTEGNLEFFIKPGEARDYSLDFSLEITPFFVDGNGTYSKVTTETEIKLLSGHILYFLKAKDSDEYIWLKDGKFNLRIPNDKEVTEYEYLIHWVWPLNLASVLLNNGDDFLNGQEVINLPETIRDDIVTDMRAYPEKYFFSSLTEKPLDTNYGEVEHIPDMYNGNYNKQLFVDLSSYYNQADMKIGQSISFIDVNLKYLGEAEVGNEE